LIRSWEGPVMAWSELAAAMGSSSVVVGLVLGQDRPRVAVTEDLHPIGDLCSDGEQQTPREVVRAGTAGRDHHGFDAALASQSLVSSPVKVLVAGLRGRCPCLSADSLAQPGERPDV